MTLSFKPDRAVHDPKDGVVRFFAAEGPRLVKCAVSKRALALLDFGASKDEPVLEGLYNRHKDRIQQIARRKYNSRQFERDGSILIQDQDVAS
jgi:Protein of unknown function (DUF1488)